MDFFSQQEHARKQSRRLVVMFVLAVGAVVVAIDLIVLGALQMSAKPSARMVPLLERHTGALILTSIVVLGVILIASLIKTTRLRAGGGVVARTLGGTPVPDGGHDIAYRRLRNVVEEIAIASGVPVPEIYVLENEPGINAFAAGFTPADAAVAVTRGCLEKLTRDELQGVIAHEFSHVLNGDMRLNIRMMGILFGLLVIGIIGREILVNGRGGGKDGAPLLAIALGVMIIGFVGLFFGRLIKARVAQQREYLADSSAVQFTRQTSGIAGALKKIAALRDGSQLATPEAEEVSHMLFGDGMRIAMFSTHPPIEDRIRRLDKSFDPAELVEIAKRWQNIDDALAADDAPASKPSRAAKPDAVAIAGAIGAAMPDVLPAAIPDAIPPVVAAPVVLAATLPPPAAQVKVDPQRVSAQVGNPSQDDYAAASSLQAGLPQSLVELAYMRDRAPALLLALALDGDPSMQERQLAAITQRLEAREATAARDLLPALANLHPMQRLPLAALAFPTIRKRPRPYLEQLAAALDDVIRADGRVHLGEYCLAQLLRVQVFDSLDPSRVQPTGSLRLVDAHEAVTSLFAVLAQHGHDDADSARRAFMAGMHPVFGTGAPPYAPPSNWITALDAAWGPLDRLNASGKQLLVEGLTRTMSHDGRIAVAESELLRTICAAVHCPLPPMLNA